LTPIAGAVRRVQSWPAAAVCFSKKKTKSRRQLANASRLPTLTRPVVAQVGHDLARVIVAQEDSVRIWLFRRHF
jgi:hypothetical protein